MATNSQSRFTKTQHKIMRYLWKKGKSSRSEIGNEIGFDTSTISRTLTPLMRKEMIRIVGESPASSKGGRKTHILSFNNSWKHILGISIEQGEVTIVLSNLAGEVLKEDYSVINVHSGNIFDIVEKNFSKYDEDAIAGISIATPGMVSSQYGKIIFSSALGIEDLEFEKHLEEKLGVKVLVMNNANAASACYSMKSTHLVYFIFSIPYKLKRPVGVGAGIMIEGKTYEGFNSYAGEFWRSFSLTDDETLTVKDLNKDISKKLKLKRFVEYFSEVLEIAIDIIDPEIYVIGGDIDLLPEWVGENLISAAYNRIPFQSTRKLKGIVDRNGTLSIAKGAALAFVGKFMGDFNFAKKVFQFLSNKEPIKYEEI